MNKTKIMARIDIEVPTQEKTLIDALKRGEKVDIFHHGRLLGVVSPVDQTPLTREEREKAMAECEFFGMSKDLPIDTVEEELRAIRRGRGKEYDEIIREIEESRKTTTQEKPDTQADRGGTADKHTRLRSSVTAGAMRSLL